MSNYIKIEPVNKKSYVYHNFWSMTEDDGNEIRFSEEELNRWGWIIIKTDKDVDTIKKEIEEEGHFDSDNYEDNDGIWETDMDDIISVDYNNCYNIDEDTLQELHEENSDWEEHGYTNEGYRIDIFGDVKVTDVTDEYGK